MFNLIKHKSNGKEKSEKFKVLEGALKEAETCKETKFELKSDIWKSFHIAGEKRDNGYIDWQTVSN
jgi:hypothetical protein